MLLESDEWEELKECDQFTEESVLFSVDIGKNREFVNICTNLSLEQIESQMKKISHIDISYILKLSVDHPDVQIRRTSINILQVFQNINNDMPKVMYPSISRYISNRTFDLIQDNETVNRLFTEYFDQTGILPLYLKVLSIHPNYLAKYIQYELLAIHSPMLALSLINRYYIAILTAAEMCCANLVKMYTNLFINHKGNPEWLKGVSHSSPKILNLLPLLRCCIHQPYTITKAHFQDLVKAGKNYWTLCELIRAIIVITHVSMISCIVIGFKITPEIELDDGHTYLSRVDLKYLMKLENDESSLISRETINSIACDQTRATLLNENEKSTTSLYWRQILTDSNIEDTRTKIFIQRFISDPNFEYVDFSLREKKDRFPPHNNSDFNWDEHGFSTIERCNSEDCQILDDKFKIAKNLNSYLPGAKLSVSTDSFSYYLWCYIQKSFGIFRENFQYDQMNKLLDPKFKEFCKKLVCYPHKLTISDYQSWYPDLKDSELIRIFILVTEAKMQSQLIYALMAITKYLMP